MGMVVQHNMNAINAYNNLNANVAGLKKASEKLSSGYRINRAGDDAAGLAISEKMRSQIKGLNQAIRNSQDGINMIQTFEGAAQETHTILQRMKELAMESANGTYDNITDRAALQLEFDQLNDELNQIADTDFNGTIVLNGGEMSDGLKVTDFDNGLGTFDYNNKASQLAAEKAEKIATLTAEKLALQANTKKDIGQDTDIFNTYDNYGYTTTEAKTLWDKDAGMGLDAAKDASISVVFEATVDADTGAITYTAVDGDKLDAAGNSNGKLTEDQLALLATTAAEITDATGYGGFTVSAGGTDNVNVIFDATEIQTGDVITLTFDGPGSAPKAPTNAGIEGYTSDADSGITYSDDTVKGSAVPVVTLAGITDDNMTKALNDAYQALDGLEFTFTAGAASEVPAANTGANIKVGGVTLAATGRHKVGEVGYSMTLSAAGVLTVNLDTTPDGAAVTDGGKLLEIDMSHLFKSAATGVSGETATFKLALDMSNYPGGNGVKTLVGDSSSYLGEANAEGLAKIKDIDAQIKALQAGDFDGVSKSDAFDNSTAIMNYAEHIVLQTGARTKDAVDFTFNYNKADMGDLKANLNLSAREDGLNTAGLSLANQKDANYAIDQIDKAINKTSMVRASFGAIQNRLEHKITNLTTTSENLTEAESNIRDTDMASEMMNYTKFNILQQAAQSMLAQANQQPQSILQLLG